MKLVSAGVSAITGACWACWRPATWISPRRAAMALRISVGGLRARRLRGQIPADVYRRKPSGHYEYDEAKIGDLVALGQTNLTSKARKRTR